MSKEYALKCKKHVQTCFNRKDEDLHFKSDETQPEEFTPVHRAKKILLVLLKKLVEY